jgi:hypothetical protein
MTGSNGPERLAGYAPIYPFISVLFLHFSDLINKAILKPQRSINHKNGTNQHGNKLQEASLN